MGKLVIDGNSVYEIDEECIRRKENRGTRKEEVREGHGSQMSHKRPQGNGLI